MAQTKTEVIKEYLDKYDGNIGNTDLARELITVKKGLFGDNIEAVRCLIKTTRSRHYKANKSIISQPIEISPKETILGDLSKRKDNAKVKELERKYNYLLNEYELSEKRFDTLLNIKEDVDILNIDPILSSNKNEAIPIIQLSDWHFEEKVDPLTINGLNEYNLDIATFRWNKCIQNSLKLVHKERHSSEIKQVVVWLGGGFYYWVHSRRIRRR